MRKFLRLPAVEERTGLARSTIYRGMKAGTFPMSVPLGPCSTAWVEDEVNDWVEARIAARAVASRPAPTRRA